MPCLHEDPRNKIDDRGDLIRSGIDAVDIRATEIGDHITVGKVGNQPTDCGRDQRQTKSQQILHHAFADSRKCEHAPQLCGKHQIRGGQNIPRHDREDVSRDTHIPYCQKQDIEQDRKSRIQYSLHGKQARAIDGTDILRTNRLYVSKKDVCNDQPRISVKIIDQSQKRRQNAKSAKSERKQGDACGKHGLLVAFALGGKAEDSVADAHARKRDQKIRRACDQLCRAVLRGGKPRRIQRHEQKHKQFGAEGSQPQNDGVGKKLFIAVHSLSSR